MSERYSPGRAWEEAEAMKKKIASGEASDYPDAEKMVEAEMADKDFVQRIATPEAFKDAYKDRPLLAAMEQVKHSVDGKTILEHTRQLLLQLRTERFSGLTLKGANVHLPDLLRTVGLYHDADKVLRAEAPSAKGADEAAIGRSLEELRKSQPAIVGDAGSSALFSELMRTCDYFGYNLALMKMREGDALAAKCEDLLDRTVYAPLARLQGESGVEIDAETLFEMQYALSRADTLAIDTYKENVGQIDALRARLLDYIS